MLTTVQMTCNSTDDTGRLDGQFLKLFGACIFLCLSLMANVIDVLYTLFIQYDFLNEITIA